MSVDERFTAAVEIIRSLPKNGNFSPPYSMQLQFYSYFKQATLGQCQGSRPAFYDLVNRAKYDAWHVLGSMPKEEAMGKYVDGFVDTIKTLQRDATPENVKEALSYAEPKHVALFKPLFEDVKNRDNVPSEYLVGQTNGHHSEDDIEKLDHDTDDGEEYSDTFNNMDDSDTNKSTSPHLAQIVANGSVHYQNVQNNNNNSVKITKVGGGDPNTCPPPPMAPYMGASRNPFPPAMGMSADYSTSGNPMMSASGGLPPTNPSGRLDGTTDMSYAVLRLQYTMEEVIRRLDHLEQTIVERRSSRWTWFGGIQPHVLAAIVCWPLLVQFVLYLIKRRRVRVQLRLK